LHVINNFIIDHHDPSRSKDLTPAALMNPDNKFRVLFAGNIGRFQSLDTVIDAAKLITNPDIEFWFVGSGVMVEKLKLQAGDLLDKSVFFHPYLPIEKAMTVIANSHLGIVSLLPGVVKSAYPSKTMSYLEAGCKLLTLVEPESELAKFVESEKIGAVCGSPDPIKMAGLITKEYNQQQEKGYDRASVRAVGRKHFGQGFILDRWIELVDSLSP
jgi:glycosyltransferase involved in cell wall biosynthesis